jgi:pimeloyl-ACP methyl ester carboxylesterase
MKSLFTTALLFLLTLSLQAQTRTEQHEAFRVEVSGQGSPLYLIPGATCSGDVWKETVARYAKSFECHVFTLAGYAGQAPLPEGDTYLARHKEGLVNYMAKHGKGTLMGHSIGGYLAMWIASEQPKLLNKVVIVDALPYLRGSMDPDTPEFDPKPAAENQFNTLKNVSDSAFSQMQKPMVQGMIKDSTRWTTVTNWGTQSDRRTLAYTTMELMAQDLRDEIAGITVPVLIMGQFDEPNPMYPDFTQQAVEKNLQAQYALIPDAKIIVAQKSRHFIMYDVPEWFYQQVDSFIAQAN